MRNILYRMNTANRVSRPEIEWAEINSIKRFLIFPMKGNPYKTLLQHILAFNIELNNAICKIDVIKPGHAISLSFREADTFLFLVRTGCNRTIKHLQLAMIV